MHLAHQGCAVLAVGQSTQVFSGTANPVIAVFPHLLIHFPLHPHILK